MNFSRSILFGYAIPFTHTGFRATYALNDQLNLILGLNNGWDQISDPNSQKTVEFGAIYTPSKTFSLTVDGYVGTEPVSIVNNVASTDSGQRVLIDVVANWAITDKVSVVGNFDYGQQKDNAVGAVTDKYEWSGGALYLKLYRSTINGRRRCAGRSSMTRTDIELELMQAAMDRNGRSSP